MSEAMSKGQLLRAFAAAYEMIITTAEAAEQNGVTSPAGTWGPREILAHLAGWEVIATVRIPHILAGMTPHDESDRQQQRVMNDALNAAMVALVGEQPLASVCGILRQAYQRDIAILSEIDDALFHPGAYVYERTKDVIEHCQEHTEMLAAHQL